MNEVKLSLGGISHNKLDSEINEVISSAMAELKISGAEATAQSSDEGALLLQAVKLYARWWFNYMGMAEDWRAAFDGLRDSIALSGLYKEADNAN